MRPLSTALGGGQIVIHKNGNNLTGSSIGTTSSGAMLTQPMLDAAVTDAISHWGIAGVSQRRLAGLANIDFEIAQFPRAILGVASSTTNKIWLDVDGAGLGWSSDVVGGGYHVLSAVTHEIGHVLGFDHDVMGESLNPGDVHLASEHLDGSRGFNSSHLVRGDFRRPAAVDKVFEGIQISRNSYRADLLSGLGDSAKLEEAIWDEELDWTAEQDETCVAEAIDSLLGDLNDGELTVV